MLSDQIQTNLDNLPEVLFDQESHGSVWTTDAFSELLLDHLGRESKRTAERFIRQSNLLPDPVPFSDILDENNRSTKQLVRQQMLEDSRRRRWLNLVIIDHKHSRGRLLACNDARNGRRWTSYDADHMSTTLLQSLLDRIVNHVNKPIYFWPHGAICQQARELARENHSNAFTSSNQIPFKLALPAYQPEILAN